jgi:sortase A
MSSNQLRRTGQCFLSAGFFLLLYVIWNWTQASAFQAYQGWLFDQKERPDASVGMATPQPHAVLGRLEIARLGVSVLIVEGVDERSLLLGAGHVPGTTLPGQRGNIAVAGHRDTFFRPLREIREGDRIALTTVSHRAEYLVESTGIVPPEATDVLRPSDKPLLTLITCYPFSYIGPAPDRFIVRARQLKSAPL